MSTTTTAGAHAAPAGGQPLRRRVQSLQLLLDAIRTEQGEWTVGRVKALYAKTVPTHMLRSVIRRHLRTLHTGGHLAIHEEAARRYYTYSPHCARCGSTTGPFDGTPYRSRCATCVKERAW
ncbi:hypothetical protein V2S66_03075 [Streptomyces sp. V4-01]|uniref:Transcriptional regulator n=1 Tax=Actinacidiphila polyblastidii TaxID=3110430 RepID=A0ABU7P6J9_9ACTN|nr:hypothetical protein [Streptomyces sp. V4-01]